MLLMRYGGENKAVVVVVYRKKGAGRNVGASVVVVVGVVIRLREKNVGGEKAVVLMFTIATVPLQNRTNLSKPGGWAHA